MEATAPPHGSEPAVAPFTDLLARYREEIGEELRAFLAAKRQETVAAAPEAAVLVDTLADLTARGGKRLRPALVRHAFLACGGGEPRAVLPLELASELLHTYLLVHDDIMDHAATRRGRPSAQVMFARRHRAAGRRGDGDDYGRSIAILVGDLAATWAFERAARMEAPAERGQALARCFAAMAQEVIHGQYLEILLSHEERPSAAELERVLRLKSGRYSVERPIELGALAAGAGDEKRAALARYGTALGEAFQLQDDLLGMFGDAETVGKPVGGDLVEGKFTFLVFHALKALGEEDRAWLQSVRGRRDLGTAEAERAQELIAASGARERVEAMIAARLEAARQHLADIRLEPAGRSFLEGLIGYSKERRQ